jgi:hypothetical protein
LNSPREPRGAFSSFEKSWVKSYALELLVKFEDKLLGELISFNKRDEMCPAYDKFPCSFIKNQNGERSNPAPVLSGDPYVDLSIQGEVLSYVNAEMFLVYPAARTVLMNRSILPLKL